MPKIQLKPNSPEFAEPDKPAAVQKGCDMPGCSCEGDYKAPKDRDLSGHYWFCLEHVQEYNKAWDYFSGMSTSQIEEHIVRSALWDRPTRRYDNHENIEAHLRRRAYEYSQPQSNAQSDEEAARRRRMAQTRNTPEFEAMAIMGLEPPLSLDAIKAQYKALVKKHHPDINPGNPQSEELLKSINMAYTILKLAYEKYEKLDPNKA